MGAEIDAASGGGNTKESFSRLLGLPKMPITGRNSNLTASADLLSIYSLTYIDGLGQRFNFRKVLPP